MHKAKLLVTTLAALGLMTGAASASSFTYVQWQRTNAWDNHHHHRPYYDYHHPVARNAFIFRIGEPIHRARWHGPVYYPVYYPQPVVVDQPVMQQIAFTNPGDDGSYCREYQAVSTVGGRRQQTYGTACMQPDGSWQIAN